MTTLFLTPNDNIQHILDGYPLDERLEVHLEAGVYTQKLRLKQNHLKLIGSQTGKTIISYGDYSYKMHADGLLYNTFRTQTVMILGDHVTLEHLTIENTSGSGFTIGQAVALTLYGNHISIKSCELIGHQDTLFIGPLPKDLTVRYDDFLPFEERQTTQTYAYFYQTKISGDVDFIFGSGTALFEDCHILAIQKGYIAAPSTDPSFAYGFIFYNCLIESITTEPVFLARPWRDFGKTHFINSKFIGQFSDVRYDAWDKTSYTFAEYPYVPSPLGVPIEEEGIEQLKQYVLKHFNRSMQMNP